MRIRHAEQVTSGRSRKGRLLVWSLMLRLVTLFIFAELSGAPHTAMDVYESLAGLESHAQDDCGDQETGHECPPGCPNCHCYHAAAATPALRLVQVALVPLLPSRRKPGFVPYVGLVPPGADPDSLYRPPRLHA